VVVVGIITGRKSKDVIGVQNEHLTAAQAAFNILAPLQVKLFIYKSSIKSLKENKC
jgi:hypothetical protein